MRIQDISTFGQIAKALGISTGYLRRLLFEERDNFYTEIEIPKKNGDSRKIFVPSGELLQLQKKLNTILISSFNPSSRAFGFVQGRSTVQNASLHLKKKYILNIDLLNFFPSISSGRVRSMFINYFKLSSIVASTLTNLCCHPDGFLPQGAPTSPTISNILCKTLDKELINLARKLGKITYSRYADDITFSTNSTFSRKLVRRNNGEICLGNELIEIVEKNGFEINSSKTRLQNNNQHQEVTGIKVNRKLNIDRRFIRKIRAMLFSIESNLDDLSIPATKFAESDYKGDSIGRLMKVIKGMISYVGMVRGKNDALFIGLAKRFNKLLLVVDQFKDEKPIVIDSGLSQLPNLVCVVPQTNIQLWKKDNEMNIFSEIDYGQGTGFLIKGIGIVSNYHVFEFVIDSIKDGFLPRETEYFVNLRFGASQSKKISAKISFFSEELDLVILIPEDQIILNNGFERELREPEQNETITLLGYPDFSEGDQLKMERGDYLRTTFSKKVEMYEISPIIFAGNSGGPIINKSDKVIGIATEGRRIALNRAIPIKYVDEEKLTTLTYTLFKF